MAPRERVPQSHIDTRKSHTDKALRAQQTESPRKFMLDLGRRQGLAQQERRDVSDQIRRRVKRGCRVSENDTVADGAVIGSDVGQD
jgi:hypothetical protein